ncbi:MAG: hypothetical protein OEV06_01325 [Anaerolineae bacterium]|nr:hypothetical protein [Anaerolineae bacterium]
MNFLRAMIKPFGGALGWLLRPVGVLAMLLLSIPWVGRPLSWLWGLLLSVPSLLGGLVEGLFWLVGLRGEKTMRVGVIILRDEGGEPLDDPEKVIHGLQRAAEIFFENARVRLLPAWPHESERYGVEDLFERTDGWVKTNPEHSRAGVLDVNCKNPALREDLGTTGGEYAFLQNSLDPRGAVRRLFGWGAPMTVFMVRSIKGFWGCSLGPLNDYVTVVGGQSQCIAHELGHACSLWHSHDKANLMHPRGCGGEEMRWWQVWMLRASRHVSYF